MPERKFLERLNAYFDLGAKRRRKKADELEKIVKKLRKLEKAMVAQCHEVPKGSRKRETLKQRYRILHAQRLKGQKVLKKIKHA